MKTNIEQSANTASVVRGRMCEVLTSGAYIEQGSVVKMTTVTTGGSKDGPVRHLGASRFVSWDSGRFRHLHGAV